MARSLKKGFYIQEKLLKKIQTMVASGDKKVIKIWDRATHILPDMVGLTVAVHNGKQFVTVYITEDMLGHRLGEFAFTRTFKGHPF
ncbi:30S ribosomal protein S19 [candidate division SR1 bacterium Aalborg_AAW-1]|nr:30S ribosomal protein S19 [candidate division SR1 bacterium Aalborg_AAW-1]